VGRGLVSLPGLGAAVRGDHDSVMIRTRDSDSGSEPESLDLDRD
jgi:hypothetical protein